MVPFSFHLYIEPFYEDFYTEASERTTQAIFDWRSGVLNWGRGLGRTGMSVSWDTFSCNLHSRCPIAHNFLNNYKMVANEPTTGIFMKTDTHWTSVWSPRWPPLLRGQQSLTETLVTQMTFRGPFLHWRGCTQGQLPFTQMPSLVLSHLSSSELNPQAEFGP